MTKIDMNRLDIERTAQSLPTVYKIVQKHKTSTDTHKRISKTPYTEHEPVNHLRNLNRIHAHNGEQGVRDYVAKIWEVYNEGKTAIKNINQIEDEL